MDCQLEKLRENLASAGDNPRIMLQAERRDALTVESLTRDGSVAGFQPPIRSSMIEFRNSLDISGNP
jgi:hypothetical protein